MFSNLPEPSEAERERADRLLVAFGQIALLALSPRATSEDRERLRDMIARILVYRRDAHHVK